MLPVVKQLSTVWQMNSVHHGDSSVTAQESEQLNGHCLVPVRFWTYDESVPGPHGQLSLVSQSFCRIALIDRTSSYLCRLPAQTVVSGTEIGFLGGARST